MDWIAVIITTARNRLPIESWTARTKPDFSIYIKNLMLNIDRQNRNTDSCIKNLWTDALTSCSDWQHFYRLLNAYHVNKITKKPLHHDTILPTDCLMVKHLNSVAQSVGKELCRQIMCVGESPVGNNLYRQT